MPNSIDNTFGGYTREQLEEALLNPLIPRKIPGDYAAVKAAISRALPANVGTSCLDITALRKLDALVQTSTGNSGLLSIVVAIGMTVYLVWRLHLEQNAETPTIYWERIAWVVGVSAVVWVSVLWKSTTNSYRFASGTSFVVYDSVGSLGEQSLADLVWVE